jgi:hypothetical protein
MTRWWKMRIKFHDQSLPVYIKAEAINTEGYKTFTWTTTYNVDIDLQPVKSDSTLKAYGLQKDDARKGFVDNSTGTPVGSVIKATDANYEVVGIHNWYDHAELICRRYEGAL